MSAGIPHGMKPFVQRLISERRYMSEQDVVTEGLRLLQARETLRDEVSRGFESLDAGQGVPADRAFARAEERIKEVVT